MRVDLFEKNFDLDEFISKIQMFEMIKGEYPNYVVMSEQTSDVIENQYRIRYVEKDVYFKNNKRYVGEFFGILVAQIQHCYIELNA